MRETFFKIKLIDCESMVIAPIQIGLLMIFGSAPGENGEISVLAQLAGLSAIGLTLTGLLIAIFGPLSWHLFRRIRIRPIEVSTVSSKSREGATFGIGIFGLWRFCVSPEALEKVEMPEFKRLSDAEILANMLNSSNKLPGLGDRTTG